MMMLEKSTMIVHTTFMKKIFSKSNFIYSFVISITLAILAYTVGKYGFKNLYYFAILLAIFIISCLCIAWFIFLNRDGLGKKNNHSKNESKAYVDEAVIINSEKQTTENYLQENRPDLSLFAPRDNTIINKKGISGSEQKNWIAILCLVAFELCVLTIVLYFFLGIGSRFYL